MSETTQTQAPQAEQQPPAPETEKPKTQRGIINKLYVDALDKAGQVTTAAKKSEYASKLVEHEIDSEFVSMLETDIANCHRRVGRATDFTSDLRVATEAEAQAKTTLLNCIKGVQAAAKQKYSRTTPRQLKDYFVGEDLDSSRAMLTQIADSILEVLTKDTLPGINGIKTAACKVARDAYENAHNAHVDLQSKATSERNAIETLVKSITDRRVQIQFAADGEWPADDNGHSPVRKEFQLPTDRPLPR
jgi:hypothetical protein